MKTPNIKRISALLCAALQILASPYALAECYEGNTTDPTPVEGLTGVFSVLNPGYIKFGDYQDGKNPADFKNDKCIVNIYGGTALGVPPGHFLSGGQGSTEDIKRCAAFTVDGSGNAARSDVSGGQYAKEFTLPDFETSKNTANNITTSNGDVLTGTDYGIVTINDQKFATFGSNSEKVTRIKNLSVGGCNSHATNTKGVAFTGGQTYFIESFTLKANCDLVVVGEGKVTLNILNTFHVGGGATCINYSSENCKKVTDGGWSQDTQKTTAAAKDKWDTMSTEDPGRLQINVHSGNLETEGQVAIAAGFLVPKGNANMMTGTPTTLVGQVVAKNILTQNNQANNFFYKEAGLTQKPGDTIAATNLTRYDDYSLAAAGVSSEVKVTGTDTDGKVFLAIQRDGTTDANGNNTVGVAGDLVVYGLDNKGAYVKTGAVYASSKIAKWADKYTKIYTDNANNLSLIGNEKDTLDTYAKGLAANAVFARPWRTAPALVDSKGSAAIFATDDGVLYSVKADGTLNWGWMPSKIAEELKTKLPSNATATTISEVIAKFHPWGQIRTIRDGKTLYITGTALGGALHFALKTSSDGSAVPSISFLDDLPGVSPGGEAYSSPTVAETWKPLFQQTSTRTSWPFGGDAPVASATGVFDGTVAYIANKKLVVRNIDGSGSVTRGGNIDASSNLLYWGPGVLFVGTVSGKLLQLDETGQATEITATDETWSTPGSILGVQGAITNGGGKLLLAQTWTGVYAATWTTAGWKKPWYTEAGGSSSSTNPTVPKLSENSTDGIMLTTLPAIAPFDNSASNNLTGAVLIPYTKGSIASKATCSNSDVSAWSFGPLDGLTGVQTSNAKMGAIGSEQRTDRAINVKTGPGEATGLSIIMFKVNGDSYVGMENTASGIGESYADKAVQKNTVPDRNLIPDGGASGDATWTKTTPPAARLNWRELTNFY